MAASPQASKFMCMYGWMEEWMEGWMDRRMEDEWMCIYSLNVRQETLHVSN